MKRITSNFTIRCSMLLAIAGSAWSEEPKQPPKEITNSIGMKLVLIPAGEFMMGSGESPEQTAAFFKANYGKDVLDADIFKHEHPQHRVRIMKPFYLGTYHVTRGQFRQFATDSGYKTDAEKNSESGALGWNPEDKKFHFIKGYSWRNAGFEQTDEHPVVNVSWNDAVAFCKWLGQKEDKRYRLPTEAEWEYACRAGTTTRYYSGDDPETLAKVANVADATLKAKFPDWRGTMKASDGYVFTSPVGQFKPNAFGLYDMHGNAWQWCADLFRADYYDRSPAHDPQGPDAGSSPVLRGASWENSPDYARSAMRNAWFPDHRGNAYGFRVVCEVAVNTDRVGEKSVPESSKPAPRQPNFKPTKPPATTAWPAGSPVSKLGAPPPAVAPFDEKKAKEHQEAWAKFVGTPVEITNTIGMKLVLIPAGEFMMGSPETEAERRADEGPQHRVRITKPFYLGVYEVTQGEYQQVMGKKPSYFSSSGDGKEQVGGQKTDRFPVENVTWDDAVEFCKLLSQKEGKTYRLPTEAEWEYACRGGTTTPFSFGSVLNGREANCGGTVPYRTSIGTRLARTATVGSYQPNLFGLYDMHGNVWEWCQDRYDEKYYVGSPSDDPMGPSEGSDRVGRGGAWTYAAWVCRSAFRGCGAPGRTDSNMGFRVARVAD